VTGEQVRKIAETKFNDLNARDLDHACRIIAGTARSMGVEVKGEAGRAVEILRYARHRGAGR
jgi:large subunit ribosomal protein L11